MFGDDLIPRPAGRAATSSAVHLQDEGKSRLATRSEKRAVHSLTIVKFAMIHRCLGLLEPSCGTYSEAGGFAGSSSVLLTPRHPGLIPGHAFPGAKSRDWPK